MNNRATDYKQRIYIIVGIVIAFNVFLLVWLFVIRDTAQWDRIRDYIWAETTQAVIVEPGQWLEQLWSASDQLVPDDWTAQMDDIDTMIIWQGTEQNALFVAGKSNFDPQAFQTAINANNTSLPYTFEEIDDNLWMFSFQTTLDRYSQPWNGNRLIDDPLLQSEKDTLHNAIIGIVSRVNPDASPIPYDGIVRRLQQSEYFTFGVKRQGRRLVTQAQLLYRQEDTSIQENKKHSISYYDNPALLGVIGFADIIDMGDITPGDIYATLQLYAPWLSLDEDDIRSLHTSLSESSVLSVYQSIGATPLSALIQIAPNPLWERVLNSVVLPVMLDVETTNTSTDIIIGQSIKQAGDTLSALDAPAGTIARIRLNLVWLQNFLETSSWLLGPINFDLQSVGTDRLEVLDGYIQETPQWLSRYGVLE